ncbi:alpha/beta fold hydrolase [Modestobacter sp. I12A-02628]|uniref:Alpha/beta fold hydrolase n=1 Tax=Goekera deserti TaxID=2497753 RepID=A0A7K3WJK5_9ACTN|nr:alpha/beta fold hydrolase [Goekera deserti]NDI47370.1 alpha/beta fold hydrolase [Goekera deserti]NEL55900.1 alpha/beta fold hydrolase [Goekera deserti]
MPGDLPGLDPAWSRLVEVTDRDGRSNAWHVLDSGGEPTTGTLLCVHGNPTWSYLWRRLVAAAPPGWRVVAPDQLGMGFSDRLGAPRTLAQRVADLGDLTDALGVTGPVVTVAHDWGGVISLGWGLDHRDQLRGVVLTNTAVAQPPDDLGPALIRLAHSRVWRTPVCVRTPTFVRAATALSWPPLPGAVRDAYAAPYAGADRRAAVGDFVADIPFTPEHPSWPELVRVNEGIRALDVPALLLWGPNDPVFAERYLAELRRRLPQARLHRFSGASHLLPEDAPQYADAVVRFVAGLDTPAAGQAAAPQPDPGRRLWSALAERAGDDDAAVVEVAGRTVSWSLLARRVEEIGRGLAVAGLRAGDRVALLVPPSVDLTAAVYAVWRAGGVIVVADQGLGLAGMRRALRSASVQHVIGSAEGLAAARLMMLPGTRFSAGPLGPAARRALGVRYSLVELARLGRQARTLGDQAHRRPVDAECAVLFTSGATGPAKGVVYTQRQALAQMELVRRTYALTPEDRLVAAFAPFALFGPGLGIGCATPAIDVTKPGTLTAAALGDAAAAIAATVVFASPAALRRVTATAGEATGAHRAALGRVRLLMSAGAPVPASLLRAAGALMPAAEAHTPYGMTECLPVTDVSLAEVEAAGTGDGVCVGRPLPGVDVRLSAVSPDGTADGPLTDAPGVTGEICVRAAHVKDHYDALWVTEQQSSRDAGWHRTGDVGHLDEGGRLWVQGRLPHVVTTAAGVLTPVGVEQRVERLDGVTAAAVVGVGPVGTQAVVVVVVPVRAPRGLGVADPDLAAAVRAAAGTEVAAVLAAPRLPVDIRHASKVDRARVARDATALLAGSR